jgi:O-antigen biosynthesis protein
MKFTGERIIPDDGSYMFQRHMETYSFALNFCGGKTVLDAGCGEGYGSSFLAGAAAAVTGVDISKEAVRHAAGKYAKDNLKYLEMDLQELSLEAGSFDVVVSSQVLEHLDNPDKFLAGVKRVLKGNGIAVICTPNKKACEDEPMGKYHARDYHLDEFRKLLSPHFADVEYYGLHFNTPADSLKAALVKAIVKYDIFGLRKLFSGNFRKKVDIAIERTVSLRITKDDVDNSLDLIGVCRR